MSTSMYFRADDEVRDAVEATAKLIGATTSKVINLALRAHFELDDQSPEAKFRELQALKNQGGEPRS